MVWAPWRWIEWSTPPNLSTHTQRLDSANSQPPSSHIRTGPHLIKHTTDVCISSSNLLRYINRISTTFYIQLFYTIFHLHYFSVLPIIQSIILQTETRYTHTHTHTHNEYNSVYFSRFYRNCVSSQQMALHHQNMLKH
jgi:hypothetical protein